MKHKQPNPHACVSKYIFFWKTCVVCNDQYRYETMWRFWVESWLGGNGNIYGFICRDCAPTKIIATKFANEDIANKKANDNSLPPTRPEPPPPLIERSY